MTRRSLIATLSVGAVLLAGVLLWVLWPSEPAPVEERARLDAGVRVDHGEETDVVDAQVQPIEPGDVAPAMRFVVADEVEDQVRVRVGAAGMWPPAKSRVALQERLPFPDATASTFGGEAVRSFEVYARTEQGAHAFWGEVTLDEVDEDGVREVALDETASIRVRVVDEAKEPLDGARVRVSRGLVGLVNLNEATEASGDAKFAAVPPGDYRVVAEADGYAGRSRLLLHTSSDSAIELQLQEGETRGLDSVEMQPRHPQAQRGDDEVGQRVELYVVDSAGSPVSNALVQVWTGRRKVHEATSRGRQPVRVTLPTPFDGRLIAYDGRRGEGQTALRLSEDGAPADEYIARLESDLFSVDLPPGRLRQEARMEQILGVRLVRDGRARLVEFESSDSPAQRAGLERGDRLIWVRQTQRGVEALVERGGQWLAFDVPAS
jgi:hypothetical protein